MESIFEPLIGKKVLLLVKMGTAGPRSCFGILEAADTQFLRVKYRTGEVKWFNLENIISAKLDEGKGEREVEYGKT